MGIFVHIGIHDQRKKYFDDRLLLLAYSLEGCSLFFWQGGAAIALATEEKRQRSEFLNIEASRPEDHRQMIATDLSHKTCADHRCHSVVGIFLI